LHLGQELVSTLEGLDLADELLELLLPRLAQVISVSLLDVAPRDRRDKQVTSHADAAVETPDRPGDLVAPQRTEPGQGVLVVGVYQGSVNVEDRGVRHDVILAVVAPARSRWSSERWPCPSSMRLPSGLAIQSKRPTPPRHAFA